MAPFISTTCEPCFSLSSMVAYESFVASTIEDLVQQLEKLAKDKKTQIVYSSN